MQSNIVQDTTATGAAELARAVALLGSPGWPFGLVAPRGERTVAAWPFYDDWRDGDRLASWSSLVCFWAGSVFSSLDELFLGDTFTAHNVWRDRVVNEMGKSGRGTSVGNLHQ